MLYTFLISGCMNHKNYDRDKKVLEIKYHKKEKIWLMHLNIYANKLVHNTWLQVLDIHVHAHTQKDIHKHTQTGINTYTKTFIHKTIHNHTQTCIHTTTNIQTHARTNHAHTNKQT